MAPTAALRRRRLSAELRQLREAAKLTQREVAERMDWSLSTINRVEKGAVRIRPADVQAMLRIFQITDQQVVDELSTLARDSRELSFTEYRDVLSPRTVEFFQLEASAEIVREVQLNVVPGLLQTEAYTRALFAAYGTGPEVADRLIQSRRDRQTLLDRETPPELFTIIDEGALRRSIGGQDVMAEQIEHLVEMSHRPRVSIQVLTFDIGAHAALPGPFIHLEFPDSDIPETIFVESPLGDSIFQNDPSTTENYRELFQKLEKVATPRSEFGRFVAK